LLHFITSTTCILPLPPHYHIISPIHPSLLFHFFFFFNDPAPTEIYTLSLHDALPISFFSSVYAVQALVVVPGTLPFGQAAATTRDRKSTRLNSSHVKISYAVFCLKKKKKKKKNIDSKIKK